LRSSTAAEISVALFLILAIVHLLRIAVPWLILSMRFWQSALQYYVCRVGSAYSVRRTPADTDKDNVAALCQELFVFCYI